MSEYDLVLNTTSGLLRIKKSCPDKKKIELIALARMLLDYYEESLEGNELKLPDKKENEKEE